MNNGNIYVGKSFWFIAA